MWLISAGTATAVSISRNCVAGWPTSGSALTLMPATSLRPSTGADLTAHAEHRQITPVALTAPNGCFPRHPRHAHMGDRSAAGLSEPEREAQFLVPVRGEVGRRSTCDDARGQNLCADPVRVPLEGRRGDSVITCPPQLDPVDDVEVSAFACFLYDAHEVTGDARSAELVTDLQVECDRLTRVGGDGPALPRCLCDD